MKEYKVMASNFYGTYRAGAFVARNQAEAIQMAKDAYKRSSAYMNDVLAFHFYIVSE